MRLTGSFQTRVIQGWSRSVPSSARGSAAPHGRSTRASEPRVHLRLSPVTSTALLTDHYELTMLQAALRSGAPQRRCVFEVFARRLPEGRRYGVVAGTGRLVEAIRDFRFGDGRAGRAARGRRGRRADAGLPRRLPLLRRRSAGYAEGECFFPGSPLVVVEACFAEGGAAGDADPLDPQPRRGRGRGRLADGLRRRRPALPGDGLAPHPRAGGGRRRPRGVRRRVRRHQQPGGGAQVRRARPPGPARTRSPCCTTTSGPRSRRRWPAWARARPCWSTPTTCPTAVRDRGRGRRTRAGRRAAGLRRPARPRPPRSGPSWTRSAPPTPGSW